MSVTILGKKDKRSDCLAISLENIKAVGQSHFQLIWEIPNIFLTSVVYNNKEQIQLIAERHNLRQVLYLM